MEPRVSQYYTTSRDSCFKVLNGRLGFINYSLKLKFPNLQSFKTLFSTKHLNNQFKKKKKLSKN